MKYPIKEAIEAKKRAYAPYSGFHVGAALLCENGKVFAGCNIENSSYPVTLCAERSAIASAISSGEIKFRAIVISGDTDYCAPCGMCRQMMDEFVTDDFEIVLAKNEDEYKVYKMKDILPLSFKFEK